MAQAQSLATFLRASTTRAADVRVADARAREAGSRVDEARARLLPSLTLTGGYTRNELAVVAEFPDGAGGSNTATISAQDQFEARAQLDVPLLDAAAWARFFGAETREEAARVRRIAADVTVSRSVVRAYYRWVGAEALVREARSSQAAAEANAEVVVSRSEAGLSSALDLHRAQAEVARTAQTVAEAELQVALAARELDVLSGLRPEGEAPAMPAGLASDEAPLASWMQTVEDIPDVRAAEADRRAAEQDRDAAWLALVPTVSAFAAERYTNAAGFGPDFLWSLGINARWTLDFGLPAAIGTQERVTERLDAEADRAREQAETRIYEAWHQARSGLSRARAARATEDASDRAEQAARAAYEAGTGTQLELIQAQRDALSARIERVRADADLIVARMDLRLLSGRPPELEGSP